MSMFGLVVFIATCVLGFTLLRRPLRDVRMGIHLSRMTTIVVEVEGLRDTMPIGSGGGFDSLAPDRQRQAHKIFEQGIAFMRKVPRHEVTAALAKNAILASRLGRQSRVASIHRLLDILVRSDVALDVDIFQSSYL